MKMERNQRIAFLLKQPMVGAVMQRVNFAWLLHKSDAKRAFFVECLFHPQRPSGFKGNEFYKLYDTQLYPNNLDYYARSINKESRLELFSKNILKHKTRFWVMSWPQENKNNKANNIFFRVFINLLFLEEKHVENLSDLNDLKHVLFKEKFKTLDSAFLFLSTLSSMFSKVPMPGEDYPWGNRIQKNYQKTLSLMANSKGVAKCFQDDQLEEQEKDFKKTMTKVKKEWGNS